MPRALPPTGSLTLGLLLGVLITASAMKLLGSFISPGSPPPHEGSTSKPTGLLDSIRQCERSLAQARARLPAGSSDGSTWIKIASLEMLRVDLLALKACSDPQRDAGAEIDPVETSDLQRRQSFLRANPEGALSRAAEAAERALGTNLERKSRRRALLLLASARSALGEHALAAAALADATRREPNEATLWMLLSGAYRRSGRFALAEAALQRAEALPESRSAKP
jgi:tetratricopeptide (TPR) repeat protein